MPGTPWSGKLFEKKSMNEIKCTIDPGKPVDSETLLKRIFT